MLHQIQMACVTNLGLSRLMSELIKPENGCGYAETPKVGDMKAKFILKL